MVDNRAWVNDYTVMIYEDDYHDKIVPHDLWTVRLNFRRTLSGDLPEKLSAALEDVALSLFLHNQEATDGDNWTLTLTTYGPPHVPDILARVAALAEEEGLGTLLTEKDIEKEQLQEKNWLVHVHENFPPITTDKFFIYGSHYEGARPENLIALKIDAATAFGSGEHETTRGCIEAFDWLQKKNLAFKNGLDMGCGSGILAIALVKLWPGLAMTAVDIDPESVIVTKRHAQMNGVTLQAEAGDGYNAPLVGKNAPYDIVAANILAGPLIAMAPQMHAVLQPGGHAVLSGLLQRQKNDVIAAHQAAGFNLVHTVDIGDWCALVVQKQLG